MNNKWDMDYVRKIAGLPIVESFDDSDDDEDPDVKVAAKDKRQAAFEKKNKNELKRAEKEADNKEKVDAKKKAEQAQAVKDEKTKKDVEKAEELKKEAEKAEEKKETPAEEKKEAKRRGRAQDENSKRGQARAWLTANPTAGRGEFLKHAATFNMASSDASAFFYSHRNKMKVAECYILAHPTMPSFVLAENRELNQMQWIDPSSPLEPLVFKTLSEAERVAKYMSEWKSQFADIIKVDLVD